MNFFRQLCLFVIFAMTSSHYCLGNAQGKEIFNGNWKFHLSKPSEMGQKCETIDFNDKDWENASLPHNAHNEPRLVNNQWQGICWYRKHFDVADYSAGKKYLIQFDGAMNRITVWINGSAVKMEQGGYLPVVVDATDYLKDKGNVIAVCLDNRDNAETGPKPLAILDFNMYGGLYRNAWFITKNKTYISNAILENRKASGGVFVTFPKVGTDKSVVKIQTHVVNENAKKQNLRVEYNIYDGEKLIKTASTKNAAVQSFGNAEFIQNVPLENVTLWSPANPHLYNLEVSLFDGEKKIDSERTRFGIREFTFKNKQLYINGEKTYLRGVNRHQEYPYIGYALSDNAQYRDAVKIKEAGFDYIRLSHYPQSPAFMDACDELGLVVADAILGWQYYNETYQFKNQCYKSARNLIRHDRNHPCVLAWEVSLNETNMPVSFMEELHKIVHEEYPGKNVYTCGWMPDVYDIYFQARQHRITHPEQMTFNKPYMVSEYGDWEYYSTNAGLNQHQHSKEKRLELSSRQFRSNGEVGQLQQAYNVQEAHNDNMNIPATGDSYWVMFDYNRGYHPQLEASGLMDIFRLPKFAYYFYQSQRPASENGGPMVKIASYWNEKSSKDVRVFSNCEQVKLYLNNHLVAFQSHDNDANCKNLNNPPFTFKMDSFKEGELRADGYIDGKKVCSDIVRTPAKVAKLKCWIDESHVAPQSGCNDEVFLYIAGVDKNGTVCPDFKEPVQIQLDDKVINLNTDGIVTEEGIATVLLGIKGKKGESTITAKSGKLKGNLTFSIK